MHVKHSHQIYNNMKFEDENMKNIQAFLRFRESRMVYEGEFPAILMPWIFADVIYQGDGVKPKSITNARIRYEEDGRGIWLTVEDLVSNFDYHADFKTYFQDFSYSVADDTLIITGETYNDPNKKYKVILL